MHPGLDLDSIAKLKQKVFRTKASVNFDACIYMFIVGIMSFGKLPPLLMKFK